MKYFDESILSIEYLGEPFLGNTLSIEINLSSKFNSETYKTTRKEFEKNLEFVTEWVILDDKDPEYSKVSKSSSLFLDESTFEKQIMVHTLVKSDVFSYKGMPFQRQYPTIDINPRKLTETIELIYQAQAVPNQNEVDRIYKHFGQLLVDFNAEINRKFKFKIKPENSEFLFQIYKSEKQAELDSKKIKNLNEERIYWKNKAETTHDELDKLTYKTDQLLVSNKELREQNDVFLEEKNFFMNSKSFKNTNELSFLEDKSQELNQTKLFNFGGKDQIATIPVLNIINNNTLDFTLMDDEICHNDIQKEVKTLKEKVSEFENILRNYRREIEHYRKIYSQHKIDFLINENKQIKVKNNSLENQLEEYKSKLLKYDFAYKYISKEFEATKGFGSFFNSKGPDESFITATNVASNLTKELIDRDKKIERLESTLQQIKNDIYHNQTL